MGISNGNCVSSGIGPHCSHPERGDGEKYDCLVKERYRCLGALNRCLANAVLDTQISYFDYTNTLKNEPNQGSLGNAFSDYYAWVWSVNDPGKSSWGFNFVDGQIHLLTYARKRASAITSCFRSAECDFGKCYCRETKCEGPCLGDAGAGGGGSKKPGIEDANSPAGDTASSGPLPTNRLAVTNSAYAIPIPVVYAKQMVAGNIIWLGEPITAETYAFEGALSVPDFTTTVNMAIGLCEGEIADIGRIWMDDELIYDNRGSNTGATRRETAFGVDVSSSGNTALTRARIVVYNGSEDQLPYNGAVAYRGLAYVVFENFNLSTLQALPQFRFEVFTEVDATADVSFSNNLPNPTAVGSTYLSGLNDALFVVDTSTAAYYVGANGSPSNHLRTGIRFVSSVDLTEVSQTDPEYTLPLSDDILLEQSFAADDVPALIFAKGADARLNLFDVGQNFVLDTLTDVAEVTAGHSSSTPNAASDRIERLIAIANNNDVSFYWCPIAGGVMTKAAQFNSAFAAKASHIVRLDRVLFPESGRPTYVNELFYPVMTLSGIDVHKSVLVRTGSVSAFEPVVPPLLHTIPAAIWGGGTGVIQGVYPLATAKALLFIVNNTAFLWEPDTGAALWATTLPEGPATRLLFTEGSGTIVRYVSASGTGYTLDLIAGNILADFTGEVPVGPQYYDPLSNSLTFMENLGNATLRRVFIGRAVSQPAPLSAVLDGLLARAGIEFTNTADVSSILVSGYALASDTTLRSALDQLQLYYPFELADIGGALTATRRATGLTVALTPDEFAGPEAGKAAVEITATDKITQIEYVTLGYQDAEQSYALAHATMRKPAFFDSETYFNDTQVQNYDAPIVMTAAQATAACERVLIEDNMRTNSAEVVVGIEHVGLTPGAVISVAFDGVAFTGMVTHILEEANVRARLALSRVDPTVYDDDASLTPVIDPTIDYPDDSLTPVASRQLVAFPVPTPRGTVRDDMVSSYNHMYVAVRPSGPLTTALDAYHRITGSVTKFATFTKYPSFGTLRRKPLVRSSVFTTDTESDLTIFFNIPPTFTAATQAELFADPKRNLLIVGQELIQFMDWTVDADGKTFHFRNLLRGLSGTDYACGRHSLNELCVPWDDDAIKPLTFRTDVFEDDYIPYSVVPAGETTLVWTNQLQATYYSARAWASTVCRRTPAGFGTGFLALSRSQMQYELDAPTAVDKDAHDYGMPKTGEVYLLLQPYDEDKFRQGVEGKLLNYVAKAPYGLAGVGSVITSNGVRNYSAEFSPYQTTDCEGSFINDRLPSTVDTANGACDIVIVFSNVARFRARYESVLQDDGSVVIERVIDDMTKYYGFYVVYHFDPGEEFGKAYTVGVL